MVVANTKAARTTFAAASIMLLFQSSTALSSGFDNTGIGSMDLIFDPARFAFEFSSTYVDRNVDYEATNPQRFSVDNDGNPFSFKPIEGGDKPKARATPNVWNYQAAAKVNVVGGIDCLVRGLNPGTILEELPQEWDGRYSVVTTDLQTFGLDTTCSLRMPVSDGMYFRVLGGGRYVQADLTVQKAANLVGFDTTADVNMSGSGFGWNAGAAFEVPEYAIRASVMYDSEVNLEADGTFEALEFYRNDTLVPGAFAKGPAQSDLVMPQAVEINLQSGIAPRWLATLGVKWVDWSVLNKLDVNIAALVDLGGGIPADIPLTTSRIFNFKDGWTIRGGIGHQLTSSLALAGAVTWDQGIGGSYSDTWQFSLGGAYDINENVKFTLGGALAYKTAAKNELVRNTTQVGDLVPSGDQFDLSYDASWNFGVLTKLKLSF